jgi:hypothetical protein
VSLGNDELVSALHGEEIRGVCVYKIDVRRDRGKRKEMRRCEYTKEKDV